MKKLLTLLCFCPIAVVAQDLYLSVKAGVANYNGELATSSFTLKQSKIMGSLGARYDITEHIAARTYLTLTSLQANDKYGTPVHQARNLNFKTGLFDWELALQYNFLNLNYNWWTPYVFAGGALYHFNPYTYTTDGIRTNLQPLSTEGEGITGTGVKPYKLTQFAVPLGVGADFALNEDMRVGVEFGYRVLFTDYLDDVSRKYINETTLRNARGQTAVDLAYRGNEVNAGPYPGPGVARGNPNARDSWYYLGLTFTVRSFVNQYKQLTRPTKRYKKVGCPERMYK
ncbi:DUF6089 family protein [Deminuibacter soli]|uniref:Outer membrane protein beta-barrel domain-containing protein n=1 Tax=Deminuibacter soli TaxID=2291815 RepID=A0A3E1NQF5_9BACT|nr:DUF6089 family protein [Deminuibacter soli]RFM30155.1 hypothetical protein DXN05_04055 [Deminuibacter soli]